VKNIIKLLVVIFVGLALILLLYFSFLPKNFTITVYQTDLTPNQLSSEIGKIINKKIFFSTAVCAAAESSCPKYLASSESSNIYQYWLFKNKISSFSEQNKTELEIYLTSGFFFISY
jgi:hypothetical protein